jgi:hypothetical protein
MGPRLLIGVRDKRVNEEGVILRGRAGWHEAICEALQGFLCCFGQEKKWLSSKHHRIGGLFELYFC